MSDHSGDGASAALLAAQEIAGAALEGGEA